MKDTKNESAGIEYPRSNPISM